MNAISNTTLSISIGLMNGEKIMEADAIAVMKLWAVNLVYLYLVRKEWVGKVGWGQVCLQEGKRQEVEGRYHSSGVVWDP